jgi:hypothetical protein
VTSVQTQAARRWWCKLTKCKSGRSSRVLSLACLPTCISALPLNSLQHSAHEWSTETRPKSDMSNVVPRTAHQDTERRKKNVRRLGCLMFCPAEGCTEADQALERGLEWGSFGADGLGVALHHCSLNTSLFLHFFPTRQGYKCNVHTRVQLFRLFSTL